MAEFILEFGTPAAERMFRDLDCFTRGYIEAMFFTNASDADDGKLSTATVADLAAETLSRIILDCQTFQTSNARALEQYCGWYDMTAAGRDFWYTRCGHGVGFWARGKDRRYQPVLDLLTEGCKTFGNLDVYSGDDGRVYLS